MGDNLSIEISKNRANEKEYILDILLLSILIQIARIIVKYILLSQLNFTYENINIVNIISIMIVGISTAFFLKNNDKYNPAGQRLINLNNKYHNKTIRLILGILMVIGIIASLYIEGGYFVTTLIMIILSLVVEPVFEEVMFREYLWNYISNFEKNDKRILIIISIISALFKLGYWDIINQNLSVIGSSFYTIDIVLSKVFFGLIFALVLGIVKLRYNDTYLCIFVHSLINVFFR